MNTYTATDGSRWHLECVCPPIPMRCADDYDGAPDSGDKRTVSAATEEGVKAAVEQFISEQE